MDYNHYMYVHCCIRTISVQVRAIPYNLLRDGDSNATETWSVQGMVTCTCTIEFGCHMCAVQFTGCTELCVDVYIHVQIWIGAKYRNLNATEIHCTGVWYVCMYLHVIACGCGLGVQTLMNQRGWQAIDRLSGTKINSDSDQKYNWNIATS